MTAVVVTRGLTLAELAHATGQPADVLANAIADELARGRLRCDVHGRFHVVSAAFEPDVFAALASLELYPETSA